MVRAVDLRPVESVVRAWRSRSVHVVADQEHSDCTVPQYRYRMELVWIFVMPIAHAQTVWIVHVPLTVAMHAQL